jgi:hypothetical protein
LCYIQQSKDVWETRRVAPKPSQQKKRRNLVYNGALCKHLLLDPKLLGHLLVKETLLFAVLILIEDDVTIVLDEAALSERTIECTEDRL